MRHILQSAEIAETPYQIRVPNLFVAKTEGNQVPLALMDRPIDAEQIKEHAYRIIDDAATDSRALINQARQRARELLAKSLEKAEACERDGFTQGMERGENEIHARLKHEAETMVDNLQSIAKKAQEEKQRVVASSEADILKLAYAVAEHILDKEISQRDDVVIDVARAAMKRVLDSDRVMAKVHPDDFEVLKTHKDLFERINDIREFHVVPDMRVERGGVILETDAGAIDARIKTQLDQVKQKFLLNDVHTDA